jgi:hypothetical protein
MAGARRLSQERAGVEGHPRVWGVGYCAERASQKPVCRAKEHAARDDRTIRQGLDYHMERKRDAFKVKLSATPIRCRFGHIAGCLMVFRLL